MPINTVLPLLSAAAPAGLTGDGPDDSSRDAEAAQKLDDQTFALLKSLQLQGASGLALELISPQLDGIPDPNARLKFASILFDMMHVRGRYADAAELIRQELAPYPPNAKVHSPPLLPLRIRFIHHQMFYRPVTELWPLMVDLLACCDQTQDPELSRGEVWARSAAMGRRHRIVWFNAWRLDKAESLYSAFALEFIREVRRQTPVFRRFWGGICLWFMRHPVGDGGWFDLARLVLIWTFFIAASSLALTRGVDSLRSTLNR